MPVPYTINDRNQVFRGDDLVAQCVDGVLEFANEDSRRYVRGITGFLARKGVISKEDAALLVAETLGEIELGEQAQEDPAPRDLDAPVPAPADPRPEDDPHLGDKSIAVVNWYWEHDQEEFFNRYKVIDREPLPNGKYLARRTTHRTCRSVVEGSL